MYASTIAADTMMDSHSGQPSRASMMSASAYRLIPAMRICATAKVPALSNWVAPLKRRRMNSGTLCTFDR